MIRRTTPNQTLIHIPIHALMKGQVMAALYDEAYEAGIALARAMTRTSVEQSMTRTVLEHALTRTGFLCRRPA